VARRASTDDAGLVADIITLAFAHDPVWSHALARPDGRIEHHMPFWRLFVTGALRYRWTWLAGDGQATSIWIPPGGTELTHAQEEALDNLVREFLGPRADDFHELIARFEAAHPQSEPHYYLTLLATHPEHRGNGIGMRLLAHDLSLIDAEQQPAYLESTNPANDRRYQSAGFEPIGSFTSPGNGPVVTTMWRPASR